MMKFGYRKESFDKKRRDLLLSATAAAGAVTFPSVWQIRRAQAATGTIVWGTNEAYSRPELIEPFSKESGVQVELALFSDPAELVAKLKTGGAGVDILLDGSYHSRQSYDAGVLQPLNLDNIPNWKYVIEAFKGAEGLFFDGKQYGVPMAWGTDSVVYRGDLVEGEINSISALFDKKYAGRIAMPGGLHESLLVGAIYLGIDDPFSMDQSELNEVVALLIKQKPLLRTYWNDIGDLKNLMGTGEVVLAWGWAPVLELVDDGIDVRWGFPKEGQLGWYDASYLTIEAEGEAKAQAEAFINFLIGDHYGRVLGEDVAYRTVSTAAISTMDAELVEKLELSDPMGYLEDAKWWVSTSDPQAYEDAWQRVLNG